MQGIFEGINHIFRFIGPLSDFLWEFPTNFEYYAKIPLLGNLSFAIILLVGSGLFFSFRLGFMQVTGFKRGVKILTRKKTVETGISPLASFFLSTAMRVGPGNIIGVTGAIAVGGPGALFWMWLSAFFGMATAYMEATLSQIFKEKKRTNLSGDFRFMEENFWEIKSGLVYFSQCYIYCMLCVVSQHKDSMSYLRRDV